MIRFKNKEYSSASEALDEYIRNFEIEQLESYKAVDRLHARNVYYNLKPQKSNRKIVDDQLLVKAKPITIEQTNNDASIDNMAIEKIENLINILSSRIEEHKSQNSVFKSDQKNKEAMDSVKESYEIIDKLNENLNFKEEAMLNTNNENQIERKRIQCANNFMNECLKIIENEPPLVTKKTNQVELNANIEKLLNDIKLELQS
jgi:lysyl-tRNA synthetase class I